MDPQWVMMNDGGRLYNFAEIWPGFQINANETRSYNLPGINPGLDSNPMVMEKRSDRSPSQKSRKQRDGDTEGVSTSNGNGCNHAPMNGSDNKRQKVVVSNENLETETDGDGNSHKVAEQPAKLVEPPKQDYIHVRARRGQATDSHSLAERARRERISERMKILQDLVPGCNKVIGKALVLDEIINYVQSLQRQVEFLSMKLEAVNARVNPGVDGFSSKDGKISLLGRVKLSKIANAHCPEKNVTRAREDVTRAIARVRVERRSSKKSLQLSLEL